MVSVSRRGVVHVSKFQLVRQPATLNESGQHVVTSLNQAASERSTSRLMMRKVGGAVRSEGRDLVVARLSSSRQILSSQGAKPLAANQSPCLSDSPHHAVPARLGDRGAVIGACFSEMFAIHAPGPISLVHNPAISTTTGAQTQCSTPI